MQLPPEPALETVKFRQRSATATAELFPHRKLKPYEDASSFAQELATARPVYAEVLGAYRQMMEGYRAGGRLDTSGVREVVNPMVESVIRNPDACVWLACSKDEQSYTWGHSAGASVWAVALGRQLGLPRVDLQRLAVGALLLDVGKLKVPEALLLKRERLTPGEFQLIKSHVEFGLQMLDGTGILSRSITDMVEFHHERHGGHGYPRGIGGDDIPVFGRIAAIVDCYDAITSRRPYAAPMSPSHAVKKLYAWRDIDFDADLVEEFIQAIGIYPAGTLLELSNGEVGVATAGYRTRRLRPQLLLVLDRDKKPYPEPRPLDLLVVTHDQDGKALEIATSLEPGSFGVDPETLAV
jgi:HD-GYP domain-containing protein (c-di-GMP phosphodiesterase class II)